MAGRQNVSSASFPHPTPDWRSDSAVTWPVVVAAVTLHAIRGFRLRLAYGFAWLWFAVLSGRIGLDAAE